MKRHPAENAIRQDEFLPLRVRCQPLNFFTSKVPTPQHNTSKVPTPQYKTSKVPAPCFVTSKVSTPQFETSKVPTPCFVTSKVPTPCIAHRRFTYSLTFLFSLAIINVAFTLHAFTCNHKCCIHSVYISHASGIVCLQT